MELSDNAKLILEEFVFPSIRHSYANDDELDVFINRGEIYFEQAYQFTDEDEALDALDAISI